MLHRPALHALQGGKEAARSNEILHRLIVEAIEDVAPEVGSYSSGSRHTLELRVPQCIAAADCLDVEHYHRRNLMLHAGSFCRCWSAPHAYCRLEVAPARHKLLHTHARMRND